jgi:hypothetical protein
MSSVCVYFMFVLSCVQVQTLCRTDPPFKESYRPSIRSSNWTKRPGPIKGGRAIIPMLGGSLVTTAWRVLRLRMEGTASRYGG